MINTLRVVSNIRSRLRTRIRQLGNCFMTADKHIPKEREALQEACEGSSNTTPRRGLNQLTQKD